MIQKFKRLSYSMYRQWAETQSYTKPAQPAHSSLFPFFFARAASPIRPSSHGPTCQNQPGTQSPSSPQRYRSKIPQPCSSRVLLWIITEWRFKLQLEIRSRSTPCGARQELEPLYKGVLGAQILMDLAETLAHHPPPPPHRYRTSRDKPTLHRLSSTSFAPVWGSLDLFHPLEWARTIVEVRGEGFATVCPPCCLPKPLLL
jgi:hypothetical protein